MDKDTLAPRNPSTEDGNLAAEPTETLAVSGARRRLIKASAAAVPAIMTLRSGAALAFTSMDCRDREAANAKLIALDADEYVRVQAIPEHRVVLDTGTYYYIKELDRYYDASGKRVANGNSNDAIALRAKIQEKINTYNPICFFVNTAYKNEIGWECAFTLSGASAVEPVLGGALLEDLNTQSDNLPVVHLLAYITWSGDQITGITYYPLQQVAADLAANEVTASCMCSVNPDYSDVCGV